MNLKTVPIEIEGIKFETTQFAAMRAYALLARLVKTIGPAMGFLANADSGARLEDLGPLLGSALSSITASEAQSLLLDVLANTTAQFRENGIEIIVNLGESKDIDRVFTGKLKTMFKVMGHALKVNYADFFDESAKEGPLT